MMSRGIVRRFILQYVQYQNICCNHSYHGSGHDLIPAVARRHCPFDLHATFLRVVPRPNAMLAVPAGSSARLPRRWPPCRVLFFFASLLSSVARMFLLYFLQSFILLYIFNHYRESWMFLYYQNRNDKKKNVTRYYKS